MSCPSTGQAVFVALSCGGDDKVRAEPCDAALIDLAAWWPPLAEPDPATR